MPNCLLCQLSVEQAMTLKELFGLSMYQHKWVCATCIESVDFLDTCHQRYIVEKDDRIKWAIAQYYARELIALKAYIVLTYPFETDGENECLIDTTANILLTQNIACYALKNCYIDIAPHWLQLDEQTVQSKTVVVVDYNGLPQSVWKEVAKRFDGNIKRMTLWKVCYGKI